MLVRIGITVTYMPTASTKLAHTTLWSVKNYPRLRRVRSNKGTKGVAKNHVNLRANQLLSDF